MWTLMRILAILFICVMIISIRDQFVERHRRRPDYQLAVFDLLFISISLTIIYLTFFAT